MRRAVDVLIELIQFAGVAVVFAGVFVALGRAVHAAVSRDREARFAGIRPDFSRTMLLGIDVLLAAAALETAVLVRDADFVRLLTVAGIRIALTLLFAADADAAASDSPGLLPTPGRRRGGDGTIPEHVHRPRPDNPYRSFENLREARAWLGRQSR